ncbi:MAG: diacylglycerol kinase family lipid kinase [Bacilli bacterium]|nr:diacylglycerol kinase family lipid kinase [Bacilli bacterium]
MKKCVIIMNPESGKVKKLDSKNKFYDILRKHDYETEIKYTKKVKDATRIIKKLDDDIDLVISAGGDGTLNEVVTGNMQRKKKLLVANLPMGTTNDVANMYGYTKNYEKNLEILLSGVKKNIDVCYINNKVFVYVACLGDYIDMAYNTPRRWKKKLGKLAYALYALKRIGKKINKYDIKYKVDGKEYEGNYSFIFITNATRVAGVDDIYYDVKLDDNMFEIALASPKNKAEILKMAVQVLGKDIKDIPGITYYQTNNLEIEFLNKPKTSWCIDGEEYKIRGKKFKFKVDKSMQMLMPKENVEKLFK